MDSIAEQLVSRLRRDPSDVQAYEALKQHYTELGDLASLVNLIAGWAEYQTIAVLSGEAYVEAARALREGGGDEQRARTLYEQALQKDPENQNAATELMAMLRNAGDSHGLAEFLDGHVRTLETHDAAPAFLAELYAQLGDLWKTVFDRPDVARPCYDRALELDPSCKSAAAATRELVEALGDAEATAQRYAAEAEAESDPERKIQLYTRLAELHATERDDLDGAVHALRAALATAPGDIQVMHQLASYLGSRAARTGGPDAIRDQRRAAELYYQIAQGVEPEDAVAYLEASLGSAPDHDGALSMLEQLTTRVGGEGLLPQYWVAYLAHAPASPETDQRRVSLAKAYERAGQIEDAIFCLEQTQADGVIAEYLAQLTARRDARPESSPGSAADNYTDSPPLAAASSSEHPTMVPPGAQPNKRASERPLNPAPRLAQLHKAVREFVAARKSDEAAALCREILDVDPSDPEAFSLLESHYRKSRDHARLRELLLTSTRVGGLSVDARKLRLREVAGICEAKLKDTDGAIEAWQSVVALDPADGEAVKSLKRLLQKMQRWDDLAAVLEREALATTRSDEKVELLSQIAAIHRDKRQDLVEAAEALRQLIALRPDAAVRNELCDMLLAIDHHADAVVLLRERVTEAADERDRVTLLRTLATTLDTKLNDGDAAFEAYQELLALRPKDAEALERMQRIDETSGNVTRLLATLERRAMVAPRAERPALFMQMGELAEGKLDDVEKASEYYGNVLDLEPAHEAALAALYGMFERRGRHTDLVELLRERALIEKEPARRVELYRRMARMQHEHLEQPAEAAETYRSLLSAREDEEALRFLVAFTREQDASPAQRADLLQRLATLVTDPSERCTLLYELSELFLHQLERPREALEAVRKIVEEVDPEFDPALDRYAELCDKLTDLPGLAKALARKLQRATDTEERIALATRLADVHEHRLPDAASAIEVLLGWTKDDPLDVRPRRRLKKLLEGSTRHADLLATLDALASLEDEFAARDAAVLEGARVAFEALHDFDGAWTRLAPLVEECHEDALALLLDIARKAGRCQQLAGLCVHAAQEASDIEVQGRHWSTAARIFADDLGDPTQALEAALRMLAADLGNRDYLAQVDDYAARVSAWPRLNQVYDKLLKLAPDDAGRVELLVRHAKLLAERAEDASEALDRILRACGLAPGDDSLLAQAETLARRAGRSEELLVVYDRKRSKTAEDTGKVELLLRAARLSDSALQDRDRANLYLKSALAIAKADSALAAEVVRTAEELDKKRPDQGGEQALRTLLRAHREIAEKAEPDIGVALILQAHTLLCERLGDERGAFDLLRQGVSLFPLRDDLYAVLLQRSIELKRLDALDAHLARAIDEAIDPKTAAVLLERRASLLEGPLGRPEDAADTFAKLTQLRPDDIATCEKLRRSLRQARRYQDLLLAVHKQMQRARSPEEKLLLLKDAAHTWEHDLKNRWEALDAWRKVLDFAPEDADAQSAVVRLDRRSAVPPAPRSTRELFSDDESTPQAAPLQDARLPAESVALLSTMDEARTPDGSGTPDEPSAPEAASFVQTAEPEHAETTLGSQAPTEPPAPALHTAPETETERELRPSEAPVTEPAGRLADPEVAPVEEPVRLFEPRGEQEPNDELAMLDAVLAAPAARSSAPPPTGPDHHDIAVVVEVEDTDHGASSPAPAAPRLTKPPTLPPRRSRSEPPATPARPSAAPSSPPPLPTSARAPVRGSAAPPPAPTVRNSAPPPIPGRSSGGALPPQLPALARGVKNPSIPPPVPPRTAPPAGAPLPSLPGRGASVPPARNASLPPPLPRRKG